MTETLKGNLGMLPGRTQRLNVLFEAFANKEVFFFTSQNKTQFSRQARPI